MFTYWHIFEERITGLVALFHPSAATARFEEEASVINVVENKYPPSALRATKPISNKLEDVGFRIISASNLNQNRDLSHALIEPRRVARVYPEHPYLSRLLSQAVAVLDGQLRLASL